MYKHCRQKKKSLFIYIVLGFLLFVVFFFKHSLVHLQCLPFRRDSDTHFYFKSMFNAVIQKTIHISILAVCELDIADKKQM